MVAVFLPGCLGRAYLKVDAIAVTPKYVLNLNSDTDTVIIPFVYYRIANLDAEGARAGSCEDMVASFDGKPADLMTAAPAAGGRAPGVYFLPSTESSAGRSAANLFNDDPSIALGKLTECRATLIVESDLNSRPGAKNQRLYILKLASKENHPSEEVTVEIFVTRLGNPSLAKITAAPMITTGVVDDVLRQLRFSGNDINTVRIAPTGNNWAESRATFEVNESRFFVPENQFLGLADAERPAAQDPGLGISTIDSTGTMQAYVKTTPASLASLVRDPQRTAIALFSLAQDTLSGSPLQARGTASAGSEKAQLVWMAPPDPERDNCSVSGNCDDGTGSGSGSSSGSGTGSGSGSGSGTGSGGPQQPLCTSGPIVQTSPCASCVGQEGGQAVTVVLTNGAGISDDEFFAHSQDLVTEFWNQQNPGRNYPSLSLNNFALARPIETRQPLLNYVTGEHFDPTSLSPDSLLKFQKAFYYAVAQLHGNAITQNILDDLNPEALKVVVVDCPIICCFVPEGYAIQSGDLQSGDLCPPPSPSPSPTTTTTTTVTPTATVTEQPTTIVTAQPTATVTAQPTATSSPSPTPTVVACNETEVSNYQNTCDSCVGTFTCVFGCTYTMADVGYSSDALAAVDEIVFGKEAHAAAACAPVEGSVGTPVVEACYCNGTVVPPDPTQTPAPTVTYTSSPVEEPTTAPTVIYTSSPVEEPTSAPTACPTSVSSCPVGQNLYCTSCMLDPETGEACCPCGCT